MTEYDMNVFKILNLLFLIVLILKLFAKDAEYKNRRTFRVFCLLSFLKSNFKQEMLNFWHY